MTTGARTPAPAAQDRIERYRAIPYEVHICAYDPDDLARVREWFADEIRPVYERWHAMHTPSGPRYFAIDGAHITSYVCDDCGAEWQRSVLREAGEAVSVCYTFQDPEKLSPSGDE